MLSKILLSCLVCFIFLDSFGQFSTLIPSNTATHVAINSGRWFEGSTWNTGTIPGDAAIVHIPVGKIVSYDSVSTAHIFAIRVDGEFNCVQTTLSDSTHIIFETLIGTMASKVRFLANDVGDGKINITITPFDILAHKNGTSGYAQVWNANAHSHYNDGETHYEVTYNTASKYRYKTHALATSDNSTNATKVTEATRTLIDDGTGILGRSSWDSTQLSIGLITMGELEIIGQEKLEMSKLSANADKGQKTINLSDIPAGWKVGDQILVSRGGESTTPSNGEDVKIIESISGTTITTTKKLNKNHWGRAADNLHCYVGNLTRNITFRSGDISDVHHRAHQMAMMNPTNVKIKNAAFIDMGRTDKSKLLDDFTWDEWVPASTFKSYSSPLGQEVAKFKRMPAKDISNSRGRYTLHLHRLGANDTTKSATIVGNVVWGNPGWGITQHHSKADISKNVIYEVIGSGLVSESGSEIGSWDDNFVVDIDKGHTTSPYVSAIYFDEYLFSGQGLGMRGRAVVCKNNVIVNAIQGVGIMNMNPNLTNSDRVDPVALSKRPGYEVDNFPLDINGYSSEGDGIIPTEPALIMENTTTIWCGDGLKSIEREMGVNHESRSVFDGFICWGADIGLRITYQADYTFRDVFISGKAPSSSFGLYMWKHSHNHYFERIKFADLAYAVTVSRLVENTNQPKKIRNNGFTPWYFIDLEVENVPKFYKIELEDPTSTTTYNEHGDNPIHLSSSDLTPRLTTFTILDSSELYVDVTGGDFRFEIDGIITDQSGSYNMGIRQSLAQGNLRLGYPERIYEFTSKAKFEEYLTKNGIFKDTANNNQLYFIINEALPDRRTFKYTKFPVRVKIKNAPSTSLYTNAAIEPSFNLEPKYQIVSRLADVSQSSTNNSITMYGGAIDVSATKAVDGNNNGRKNVNQYQDGLLPVGSWSETNVELEPWYDLDLKETKDIKYIELWNIVDTNGYEIETMGSNFKDFYVLISDNPFGTATLSQALTIAHTSYLKNSTPTRKFSINDIGVKGRYIRIQAIGTTKLELAEVEVVGRKSICPKSNAGDDKTSCVGSSVLLDANNTDFGTGAWTWSPSAPVYENSTTASDYNAEISFSSGGVYTGTWSLTSGTCTLSSNEMTVSINSPNSVVTTDASGSCYSRGDANWTHILDNSQNIIASFKDNGQNLGQVDAKVFYHGGNAFNINSGGIGACSQEAVMNRSYVINTEKTPTGNVSLRLYFTDAELTDLIQKASSNSCDRDNLNSISGLYVTQVSGASQEDGVFDVNDGTITGHTTINNGLGNATWSANYIEFDVTKFSEFWIHGSPSNTPLPVELSNFEVKCADKNKSILSWTTTSELNSNYFLLERSLDAENWSKVGIVSASGNSNQTNQYTFIDYGAFTESLQYYRLTQVDSDGQKKVYPAIYRKCNFTEPSMKIYPNPSYLGNFTLEINSDFSNDNSEVVISDVQGRVIAKRKINIEIGSQEFNFTDINLKAGTYLVHIKIGDKTLFSPEKINVIFN